MGLRALGGISSGEKGVANGVATLNSSGRLSNGQLLGDQWLGGGQIRSGVVVLTNTNLETAGQWANISASWIGASPVALLAGVGAGNCLYLGCDSPSWGGLGHTVGTAMVLGAGSVVVETWNGAAWTATPCMETGNVAPYIMRANALFRTTGAAHVRFGTVGSGTTQKTLDGNTKYWIRVRVVVGITTAPTASGGYLVKDATLAHADGVLEYFGAARPDHSEEIPRANWTIQGGSAPGSTNVSVSANITDGINYNTFPDGADRGLVTNHRINEYLDTSSPLELAILWFPNAAAVAPNDKVEWRLRHADVFEDVTVLDGTVAEVLQTVISTASGTAKRVQESEIDIDVSDHIADSYVYLKIARNAGPGNANDTYPNSTMLVQTYAVGRAWRN